MLCKCKAPEADMLAGRFNCGGAYIAPCLNCNKNIKMGTENYAVMLPKREEVEAMLNDLPDAESDLNEIEKLKLEIKKLIDAEIEKMKLEREKLIRQVCKNLFYFFMVYVFVRIGLHYAEVWYLSKYRGF